uniref:Uncharacterized protein n=1 Tax=viral metagenome TaxID=1070528 RepID=A0A6C0I6Z2_9ZZZZ
MQFNNYSSSNYNQYQYNPSLYNTSNANYNNYNKINHNYIMKQDIYDSIVKYYGDIVMTKLNSKSTSDGSTYGLYYCRVGCMLCIDNRYILVIVRENTNNGVEIPVGTQIYLSNLQWISFQTRSIDDFETVNPHDIKMKQQNVTNNRNTIIDMEMKLSEELNDRIRYDCSEHYPVTVDIMKKKAKEKNIYDMMDGYEKEYYTPTCSLQTLLESYQCVLTLNV